MVYNGAGTIIYYDEVMTPSKFHYWFVEDHFEALCDFSYKPFDLYVKFHQNDSMIEFLCEEMSEGRGTWDIHEFMSLGIITHFLEKRKDQNIQ